MVNDLDGPIVKFTKRTLRDFPNQTVALYKAMIWRDKYFYVAIFITTVLLVRGLTFIIHTFDTLPLIVLFTGMYYILSAVMILIVEQTSRDRSRVSDFDMREAYGNLTHVAYWVQNIVDGVRQHSHMNSSQFAFELMMISIVMAIVLPKIPMDAIVWILVVLILLGPGLIYSWGNHQPIAQPPAQPAAQPAAQPVDQPVDQPSERYVPPPPRRNVPRYDDRSLPSKLH